MIEFLSPLSEFQFLTVLTGSLVVIGVMLLVAGYIHRRHTRLASKLQLLSQSNQQHVTKIQATEFITAPDPTTNKRLQLSGKYFKFLAVGIVGGGCIALWYFSGQLLFAGLIFFSVTVGFFYITDLISSRQKKKLSDQFPEALDLMVRSGRVGVTPQDSMRQVAEKMPLPISRIFKSLSEQLDIGLSFEKVLSDVARELDIKEFRYLTITLMIQRRTGGRYVDVLEHLSQTLREYQDQSRKSAAMTSEIRLASKVVFLLSILSCALLFFLNRSQFDFFLYDDTGQQLLIYCITSIVAGFLMMQQMLRRFNR